MHRIKKLHKKSRFGKLIVFINYFSSPFDTFPYAKVAQYPNYCQSTSELPSYSAHMLYSIRYLKSSSSVNEKQKLYLKKWKSSDYYLIFLVKIINFYHHQNDNNFKFLLTACTRYTYSQNSLTGSLRYLVLRGPNAVVHNVSLAWGQHVVFKRSDGVIQYFVFHGLSHVLHGTSLKKIKYIIHKHWTQVSFQFYLILCANVFWQIIKNIFI